MLNITKVLVAKFQILKIIEPSLKLLRFKISCLIVYLLGYDYWLSYIGGLHWVLETSPKYYPVSIEFTIMNNPELFSGIPVAILKQSWSILCPPIKEDVREINIKLERLLTTLISCRGRWEGPFWTGSQRSCDSFQRPRVTFSRVTWHVFKGHMTRFKGSREDFRQIHHTRWHEYRNFLNGPQLLRQIVSRLFRYTTPGTYN